MIKHSGSESTKRILNLRMSNKNWQKLNFLLIPFQVSEFLLIFNKCDKNEKSGVAFLFFFFLGYVRTYFVFVCYAVNNVDRQKKFLFRVVRTTYSETGSTDY